MAEEKTGTTTAGAAKSTAAGRAKSTAKKKSSNKAKSTEKWTPQMQFSKRIARVITTYWLLYVTAAFVMLVIFHAVDALMSLTGWVTAVMITMVGAYTGNSIYEKHLDKGLGKNFYVHKPAGSDDAEEAEDETEAGDTESGGTENG